MGWGAMNQGGSKSDRLDTFVQFKEGKPVKLHALLERGEEPKSYWTHWVQEAKTQIRCPGRGVCPACTARVPAKMTHAMNVWDYNEGKIKVLEKGNQVYENVKMFYEINNNSLEAIDIVIKQTGTKRDTKYVVAAVPCNTPPDTSKHTKHDLESLLKPHTPAEVQAALGGGVGPVRGEDVLESTVAAEEADLEFPTDPVEPDSAEVTMPTGKYKGQRLIDIVKKDRNYVTWVSENFTDSNIIEAANEALNSTDREPVPPKPENPMTPIMTVTQDQLKTARFKFHTKALSLVQDYKTKVGNIDAVTKLMKETSKKITLKDFTEQELEQFVKSMEDLVESLQYDTKA